MRDTAHGSFRAERIRWWTATATKTRSSRLREIAAKEIKPDEVKEEYIRSLQKHAEVDEPEEARTDEDLGREDPQYRAVTEEELLRALTTEAQRRAEPQPEPEADYEE
jgi:DNA-directed RNA polymerase subunit omega